MEDAKGFYTGERLLTYKDLNGNKPEYFICTSNRSAGKTFYFNSYALRNFKNKGSKFALIYRYEKELSNAIADEFFGHISNAPEFSHDEMHSKKQAEGLYHELYFNDEVCGYAVTLNKASALRKKAPALNDVGLMLFDEFQTEDNRYIPNEIEKLMSVHTTLARGYGQQVKYLPVIMMGNTYTILNPYFRAFGIAQRLKHNTKFLRGNGWVLEQDFNKRAYEEMSNSLFMQALKDNPYVAYAAEGRYINDTTAFIGKPEGKGSYLCTIKHEEQMYGIRTYDRDNLIYMDRRADDSYPIKLAVTIGDHAQGFTLFGKTDYIRNILRQYFHRGYFRFSDIGAKAALLDALSY